MNRLDVEMLNNSLNNLGQSALQRRQMENQRAAEMQKLSLEQQMRDIQQSRYDAQSQHYQTIEEQNAARGAAAEQNATKKTIQAYIADPNDHTKGVLFQGSPEQLDAVVQAGAKKYGAEPDVMPSAPGSPTGGNKQPYASHTIGGSTFHFYDKADNDQFVSDMEKKGFMTGGVAPAKETPSDTDTQKIEQTIPAQDAKPASPGVHHWFSPDEPPTAATPAIPATTITTTRRNPSAGMPPQLPGASSLPSVVPTAPGALPTSAPLVPTGGGLPLPPAAPQASAGPATVNTQADYDALPPGTPYVDSQGNKAVKSGKANTNQQ